MRAAIMYINTRHYSFLEGRDRSFAEDKNFNYCLSIHKLRIGTFAALITLTALVMCL